MFTGCIQIYLREKKINPPSRQTESSFRSDSQSPVSPRPEYTGAADGKHVLLLKGARDKRLLLLVSGGGNFIVFSQLKKRGKKEREKEKFH